MILAVNTAAPQFSLALLSLDGNVMAEHVMAAGKGRFGNLMPTLQFMLQSIERHISEITAIAVAIGPGSFTGLRIGISLAKGLSHGLGAPILGISSLEAMAVQVSFTDLPIVSMLHSRKGEVFAAQFIQDEDGWLRRIIDDTWVELTNIPHLFDGPALFVGNDYANQGKRLALLLKHGGRIAPPFCWCPRASSLGSLALERFERGEKDNPHTLQPVYLRPPDIRPNPFAVSS